MLLPRYVAEFLRHLWFDRSGQDMIEYALLAAALVIVVAGFLPPVIAPLISNIFSTVSSMLSAAPK